MRARRKCSSLSARVPLRPSYLTLIDFSCMNGQVRTLMTRL